MDDNIETIIAQLQDGSITISKVPKEYKKNPDILKAYEELKNQKLISKVLRSIEKKQDISELKDSPESVFRCPEIIKAILDKDIYPEYKRMLEQRNNAVCTEKEMKYRKFVSENPEYFKDVQEFSKTMLRCGYDGIKDKFVIYEELRGITHIYSPDGSDNPSIFDKSTIILGKFDDDETRKNRYYKDYYKEFSTLHDFIEYINLNSYDIYSNSCFKYYTFSSAEAEEYNLNIEKLQACRINTFDGYESFDDMLFRFQEGKTNVKVRKKFDDAYYVKVSGNSIDLGEPQNEMIRFDFFFEFESFLRGDLSDANLIFCEELEKLNKAYISDINFSGARVISRVCEHLNLSILNISKDIYPLDNNEVSAENHYELMPVNSAEIQMMCEERKLICSEHQSALSGEYKHNVFYYFSDLHLADRFNILKAQGECINQEDEIYLMQKIVDDIFKPVIHEIISSMGYHKFLLISGDVSRDVRLYSLFINAINVIREKRSIKSLKIIFTFGNREYYGMNEKELRKIRRMIYDSRMYLLQNEIFLVDKDNWTRTVLHDEISKLLKKPADFHNLLSTAKTIIFGGTGFKVNNDYYPSVNSDEFEEIYEVLTRHASSNHIVIMSHYPPINDTKTDGLSYHCEYRELCPGFNYVHGHTHNNYYYNDGNIAIYADCQLYANEKTGIITPIEVKKFYEENAYELFVDWDDKIYRITKEQYKDYMRGKNISMQLNRELDKLYLLKKNNYNCFIHESHGVISIMNGGVMKKIPEANNVQYVYDNMESVINIIKGPLSEFDKLLQYVSKTIKSIGGTGKIHGCIVDIDYFNHIYVNSHDQTITPYSALSIKDKLVYPNIAMLLEHEAEFMYDNMIALINQKNYVEDNALMTVKDMFYIRCGINEPVKYESTDIYSDSLKIKKMQKLNSGILSMWCNPASVVNTNTKNQIESKTTNVLPSEKNTNVPFIDLKAIIHNK